jgi:hypothetical protein
MNKTNGITPFEVTEGNLKAVKDISGFGGPNMWHLWIKAKDRYWEDVQWMSYYNIQKFFNAKLPYYKEVEEYDQPTYELALN